MANIYALCGIQKDGYCVAYNETVYREGKSGFTSLLPSTTYIGLLMNFMKTSGDKKRKR